MHHSAGHPDTLFLSTKEHLVSMDISDRDDPKEVDALGVTLDDGSTGGLLGLRVTEDGTTAFGSDRAEYGDGVVHSFDVSDPQNMSELDTLADADGRFDYGHGIALGPDENHLYVTGYRGEFCSIDVSDPNNLAIADSVDVPATHDVEVRSDGDYAFVSQYGNPDTPTEDSAYVFDISDPTDMNIVSSIDLPGDEKAAGARLDATENYVYMNSGNADKQSYLITLDVSNPEDISIADEREYERMYRFRVDGDFLLSSHIESPGVTAWDISTPDSPAHIYSNKTLSEEPVGDLQNVGDWLYQTGRTSELFVYDISTLRD